MRKIARYGWQKDSLDPRDFKLASPVKVGELPSQVDLSGFLSAPFDQGQLGSCTGNAIANAIIFEQNRQLIFRVIPSRLFIYYNERAMEGTTASDSGAQIRDGFKSVAAQGACPEENWLYTESLFAVKPPDSCYALALRDLVSSYLSVNQDVDSMRACLASQYPFVFGFTVYESFESEAVAQSGIVPMPTPGEAIVGGHAVLCVGYDDAAQQFIIRNSWGPDWGQAGNAKMPYAYLADASLCADFWTIRSLQVA